MNILKSLIDRRWGLVPFFWRNWSEYLVEDGRISSDQRWQWSGGAKSSETTQLQGVCTDGWPSSRRGWSTCSYSPEVSKLCFLGERNAVRRSVRGLPVKYWSANLINSWWIEVRNMTNSYSVSLSVIIPETAFKANMLSGVHKRPWDP